MSTPAPKRPRTDDGPSPATAANPPPHGKVVLDVGGTRFVSLQAMLMLKSASEYFLLLLVRTIHLIYSLRSLHWYPSHEQYLSRF